MPRDWLAMAMGWPTFMVRDRTAPYLNWVGLEGLKQCYWGYLIELRFNPLMHKVAKIARSP